MSAIVFEKVTKNFEKNTALLATDFQINEKGIYSFFGTKLLLLLLSRINKTPFKWSISC